MLLADGRVKEKCRSGFAEDGQAAAKGARYCYVRQLSVSGPAGTRFPLMDEEMERRHPATQKEDGELQSRQRLRQRLKTEFPRFPICLVADALYACQASVPVGQPCDWKDSLTRKEGRQPATGDERLKRLPRHRAKSASASRRDLAPKQPARSR